MPVHKGCRFVDEAHLRFAAQTRMVRKTRLGSFQGGFFLGPRTNKTCGESNKGKFNRGVRNKPPFCVRIDANPVPNRGEILTIRTIFDYYLRNTDECEPCVRLSLLVGASADATLLKGPK